MLEPPDTTVRVFKPMTKEEWEKQQSVTRRMFDPDTGRTRSVQNKNDNNFILEKNQ